MEWKSNARYNQPLESGSIYSLKPKGHISVHRIHGLGNDFYLSCPPLRIAGHHLGTDDFPTAVNKAREIIKETLDEINAEYGAFASDDTTIEIVRY